MSVIFGIRGQEHSTVDEKSLLEMGQTTERYALDGTTVCANGRIGMGLQPNHTHDRSQLQLKPVLHPRGNMVTLDGRLDNHRELKFQFGLAPGASDSELILGLFLAMGEACFARFIGDWAIALWDEKEQCLYLARDHAGTRTLYMGIEGGQIVWATYLEAFFTARSSFPFNEAYASAYLGCQSVGDQTPYKGIRSIPPAHYLKISNDRISTARHWDWMAKNTLHYQKDEDYQEHFLSLFEQAVARRTASGDPVVAQLSGGMDSTSIVCMSDHIRRSIGALPDGLVETISYFDDAEPCWNERPYFTAVEQCRGKSGIHIETSLIDRSFEPGDPRYLLPGPDSTSLSKEEQLEEKLAGKSYRAILSGIGGDELLGGVPTPLPELSDYLISFQLGTLFRRSMEWCLFNRRPIVELLLETVRFTASLYPYPPRHFGKMPPWIQSSACRVHDSHRRAAADQIPTVGYRPSSVDCGVTWWMLMETLPHQFPGICVRREYRYPMLDRDLVEFLFRIPRERLLRPGRRRSLMRASLRHLVPELVIERRRKAYLARGPLLSLLDNTQKLKSLFTRSYLQQFSLIDERIIHSLLDRPDLIETSQWKRALTRCASLEVWLRSQVNPGNGPSRLCLRSAR